MKSNCCCSGTACGYHLLFWHIRTPFHVQLLDARAMVRGLQAMAARQPVMFQARQQAAARQPGAVGFSSGPQPRSPAGHGTAVDFQEAQRLQTELLQVDTMAWKGDAKPNAPCLGCLMCDVMPGNLHLGASNCRQLLCHSPVRAISSGALTRPSQFLKNAIQGQQYLLVSPAAGR